MSRLNSPLIPIFLTVSADIFGLTMMIPLLPFYAQKLHASEFQVGLLFSSFAICQLVSGPILGRLSDIIGRKPTLLISQVGTMTGFIIFGFANSLWVLFLARVIDGLTAGNLSIAQAYISDVTKPENRTRAFAIIGISFGMGFLIGPAISGYLGHNFGYHVPAFGAAGLSLTSVLFTTFLLPNIRPSTTRQGFFTQFGKYFKRARTRLHLFNFFGFTLAFAILISGMALFLAHRFGYQADQVGYVYAFSGVVGLIVQGGLIGRLAGRLGERRLAIIGFLAMGIGGGLLGVVFQLPWLLVVTAIGGFGSAVTRPALTTLITRSVGPDEQGAALGVSQSMASAAQIIGPLISGALIQEHLYWAYGLAVALVALTAAFSLLRQHDDGILPDGTAEADRVGSAA